MSLSFKAISKSDTTLSILLVLIFLFLGLVGILNHEMWRDELQAWMIARDSNSIADLLGHLRYEGHPGLWYFCLYAITQITRNPVAMQFFHLGIATSSIYLFVRFSPFTWLQKILFTFSYFPLYEYGIISRSYGLGILLIFGFCVLYRSRNQILLSILLVLLANTSLYGLGIAISLQFLLVLDSFKTTASYHLSSKAKAGLIIFALGIALAVFQLIPPTDSRLISDGATVSDSLSGLKRVVKSLWSAYFPVPNFLESRSWGSNIADLLPSHLIVQLTRSMFTLGILFFSAKLLKHCRITLVAYIAGAAGLLLLNYFNHNLAIRHCGYLFILLIIYLWLSIYYTPSLKERSLETRTKLRSWGLNLLLSLHFLAGIYSLSVDILRPFSASLQAATFIQSRQLDNIPMIGSRDFAVSAVSAYLDRDIYYLESSSFGGFIVWSDRRKKIEPEKVVEAASQLLTPAQPKVLLISSQILNNPPSNVGFKNLIYFNQSLTDEDFYLYLLEK